MSCNLIRLRPLAVIPLHCQTVTWRWQWERCSWFCVRVCVFQNNPMPPLSAYWPTVPTTSALANLLVQHLPIPWITFSLYNWIRNCMWVSCFYSDCCHQLLFIPKLLILMWLIPRKTPCHLLFIWVGKQNGQGVCRFGHNMYGPAGAQYGYSRIRPHHGDGKNFKWQRLSVRSLHFKEV